MELSETFLRSLYTFTPNIKVMTYHVTIMQCWTEAEDTKVKVSCSYIPQYDINICIPQAEQIMCTIYSWELCESWIIVNLTWAKLLLAVLHCRPQFRKAASSIFWIMTGTLSRAPLQIPAIFILWLISNLNLHFTVRYVLSSSPSLCPIWNLLSIGFCWHVILPLSFILY